MEERSPRTLHDFTVGPDEALSGAMAQLDAAGTGALVVVDWAGSILGLLTDGDVRRALLAGTPLSAPCGDVAETNPKTVGPRVSADEALQTMLRAQIDHLPVVDRDGLLCDLLLRKDLIGDEPTTMASFVEPELATIGPDASLSEAIARLNDAGTGALVICAADGTLEGLLSDGDIRRAVLSGTPLDQACYTVATHAPWTTRAPVNVREALRSMIKRDVNHLPVVDKRGRLVHLLLRRNANEKGRKNITAVIMAGGFGTRLMPLTDSTPKPMLPLGDRPLLARTIERVRDAGIREVCITTHYLPESIQSYFGSGQRFGVEVQYCFEEQPLGTAGGLRLLDRPDRTLLVMNGDIITGAAFERMIRFHEGEQADLTIGVRRYEMQVPYGVVECEGGFVTSLKEKPQIGFLVNAGVYLLDPPAFDLIPEGKRSDMTDLIEDMVQRGLKVASFPIIEYWIDIGQIEDYERAKKDHSSGRI